MGALALGDLVKSTLGPKGMNKILHSTSTGEITVTNDGATILKSIALDNPAAKILVNISKVQDDEVGDGPFRRQRRARLLIWSQERRLSLCSRLSCSERRRSSSRWVGCTPRRECFIAGIPSC